MLCEIFMHVNRILTKLHELKLGGPVIMPHHVVLKADVWIVELSLLQQ